MICFTPRPARTSSGSSKVARRRARIRLIDGVVTPTRSAARVTLASSSNACRAGRRPQSKVVIYDKYTLLWIALVDIVSATHDHGMDTLRRPEIVSLLDTLFADADRADAPLLARFGAMRPEARATMLADYRRTYAEEAVEAYLPTSREAGRLLYTLARSRDASTIVEFGTSFGLSTIHLAAALADRGGGRLITAELSPTKAERALANLERAGLAELVEVRVGDALETLVDLPPTDLLYLDGAKQLYRPILDRAEPALTPRALVVADNVDFGNLVADFTSYIRDPANGYVSNRVVIAGAPLQVAVRVGGPSSLAPQAPDGQAGYSVQRPGSP